jgi:hypothetical protein
LHATAEGQRGPEVVGGGSAQWKKKTKFISCSCPSSATMSSVHFP